MNQVTILFFANLRDITGERRMSKMVPEDLLIAGLKDLLAEEFPGLKEIMPSVIVSLNHEFAFGNTLIPSGAEVALFPPVSGG